MSLVLVCAQILLIVNLYNGRVHNLIHIANLNMKYRQLVQVIQFMIKIGLVVKNAPFIMLAV